MFSRHLFLLLSALVLPALRAQTDSPLPPARAETVLPPPLDMVDIAISADGRHVAVAKGSNAGMIALLDGIAGPAYPSFTLPSLAISPDGKHVAYEAIKESRRVLVVDGRETNAYDHFRTINFVFSPDGKHLAYMAHRDDAARQMTVIDGRRSPEYDDFQGQAALVFSPDGNRLAYPIRNGEKWEVVVDDKASSDFANFGGNSLIFSPDSKRVAYAVQIGAKWSVVVDGKQVGGQYEGAGALAFSADSKRVAFSAQIGRSWQMDNNWRVAMTTRRNPSSAPTDAALPTPRRSARVSSWRLTARRQGRIMKTSAYPSSVPMASVWCMRPRRIEDGSW
jgi:roadblock/LC7 domain-containing protein